MAIGLSQSLICGASIGGLLVNAFSSHPLDPSRPLIDLPVTAFLAPAEMAGRTRGAALRPASDASCALRKKSGDRLDHARARAFECYWGGAAGCG